MPGVDQLDLRTHDLGSRAAALRIDHDQRRQTGDFVDLLGDREAFLDVLELRLAGELGDDRARQRIPVGQHGAGLDLLVGLDRQDRTVRHLVAFALAAVLVVDDDFARTRDHDQLALAVGHVAHRGVEADHAVGLGFDAGGDGRARCRTTDVEGPHRQLRAGLADRLRRDHADRFADVDQAAAAQVAAVALGADAEAGFAGQRGAHLDFVDAFGFEHFDHVFVEHLAGRQQHAVLRVQHVFGRGAAEDTVAQRFDDFTAFDDGAHQRAVLRAAILLGHDQILRHVDQATRQVAGVRGLQRRVGQTLAGTVGGDEVLQHVQAFAEVRGDRRLDDRAVRLGHQAAHAGHLADLRGGTARTGVGHHVDGVEGLLLDFLAVAVGDLLLRELGHHDLRHFVAGLAPDVDHLVVALAGGHQTGDVLLLDLFDFLLGALDDAVLLRRHQHVVDADRDAGLGRQAEAVLQQLVGEHHGLFQAALAERDVDELGDFLLLQRLVDVRERQALGQDLGQQRAADGGVDQAWSTA